MRITLTGLSHKSAPVELRERLAVGPEAVPERLLLLREAVGWEECALLATCNRMEVYGVATPRNGVEPEPCTERLSRHLARESGWGDARLQPHLYSLESTLAVRHLFRVASGLDSMVVGESQVLSQVKDALAGAQEAGTAGPVLQSLFRHAIESGKRARTDTEIARGAVSISWAAVKLAQQIFGRQQPRTALIVGAGETGERTARALLAERVASRLLVCNRTWERAAALAGQWGAEAVPFERLAEALARADIVLSSTGAPRPILTCDMLRHAVHARRGRPIFLIDTAVPRDVEPEAADLEDVFLYNIDDLQEVVDKSLAVRQAEVERVETIVEEEVRRFSVWLRTQEVGPTIAALHRRAELIRAGELEQLRGRLSHLSAQDLLAVEAALRATVNKLLHPPIVHLRAAAASGSSIHETEAIRTIFGLNEPAPPAAITSDPSDRSEPSDPSNPSDPSDPSDPPNGRRNSLPETDDPIVYIPQDKRVTPESPDAEARR